MKKEINHLLETNGASLKLNGIFSLKRHLFYDDLSGRDIDIVELICDLPGFPAGWSEWVYARDYATLMAEVEAKMGSMMREATEKVTKSFKAGKLW